MTILNLQNVTKSFGVDEVIRDASLTLNEGERLGLVGVNGSGKTTLLRILIGEIHQDEGNINLARGIRAGYLSQVYHPAQGNTVLMEAEEAFSDLKVMEERIRLLEGRMGETGLQGQLQAVMDEYARLTERYEHAGGYEARSQLQGVLAGLGFQADQFGQQAATLSGGELTRLGLAKLLLQKPDLLLLDEPTNHLDMNTLRWLEDYLKSYPGALIVISHDRYFLDAICTDIAEMLFGVLESYHGNYSSYMKQRDERFESRRRAYQQQQREIARQRAIIARFRSFNREKSIRAAESREKALDRMETVVRPQDTKAIFFRFEARRRLGDIALRTENLAKSYGGRILFEHIDLKLSGGDRAALIGPNGIGKTTLLKCLVGLVDLDTGNVEFAPKADIGYYDQRQLDLDSEKDVLNEVWDAFPLLSQSQIRGALGLFLFSGDDVFTPIRLLSGGERSRVSLAKLMLRKDNLLLLDEPTNHLDADSREALEKALDGYEGTILAVSHDRYFINRFANRILLMDETGITSFEGNYDSYLAEISRQESERAEVPFTKTKTELARERRAERQIEEQGNDLRQAVRIAEEAAHRAESRVLEATAHQARPEIYSDPVKAASQAKLCFQLRKEAEAMFQVWAGAEEALRGFLEKLADAKKISS